MIDVEEIAFSTSQSSVAVDIRAVSEVSWGFLCRFGEPDWEWKSKSSSQFSDGTAGKSVEAMRQEKKRVKIPEAVWTARADIVSCHLRERT